MKTAIVLVIIAFMLTALAFHGGQALAANGNYMSGVQSWQATCSISLGCPGCPGCPDNPGRVPGEPGCY